LILFFEFYLVVLAQNFHFFTENQTQNWIASFDRRASLGTIGAKFGELALMVQVKKVSRYKLTFYIILEHGQAWLLSKYFNEILKYVPFQNNSNWSF
jgi:hypothetical protein